jgi:hypothetical protein
VAIALSVPLVAVAWSVFRSIRYAYCSPPSADESVNEVADGDSDDATVVVVANLSSDRSMSIPPSEESSSFCHDTVISDESESAVADTPDDAGNPVVAVTSLDNSVGILAHRFNSVKELLAVLTSCVRVTERRASVVRDAGDVSVITRGTAA